MKKTICGLLALLGFFANAENLFRNGDFEKLQAKKKHLPAIWGISPRDNAFKIDKEDAVSGKNAVQISIPTGKEGSFCFHQRGKVKIPANTPIKLSGWFKSEKYRAVKGKKSRRGISMNVLFADGSRGYPTLFFRPSYGKWQYKEKIFKYSKKIVKINYVYLVHNNASGTVKYDNLYFGPWTEKDKNAQLNALAVISQVKKAPIIDGKLDDDCWKNAVLLSNFVIMGKKKAFASNQTEVYMAYDASNLYIATRAYARVLDPVYQETTKFKVTYKKRDSSVFRDDCVEIFIEPNKKTYYHFAYNSLATRYDADRKQREWNTQWTVKTSQNHKAWLAEVCIPWQSLGIATNKTKSFKFNFCRNEPADKEISAWNPTQSSFHDRDSFANGVLSKNTVQTKVKNLVFANITLGSKPINFEFKSGKDSSVNVILNTYKKGKNRPFSKNVKILTETPARTTVDMSFNKIGDYNYNYSIISNNTGQLLLRSPLYKVKASLVKPVKVKLNFKGKTVISVDGKEINSNKFFLKEGINDLSISCSGTGPLTGGITLPNGLGGKAEFIKITANVKGKALIKRKILLKSSKIKIVWVERGLHLIRNTSQHAPIQIQNPSGKTLELIFPESLSLIGVKDGTRLKSYGGLNVISKAGKSQIIAGRKYKKYQFIYTGKQLKSYPQAILYHAASNAPATGTAIYFRVKSANTIEVWNKVSVKAMPAIKGSRPRILGTEFCHAFGTGIYNQEQIDTLFKGFGDIGFNSVNERVLCYNDDSFYKASLKAKLKVFVEFHMHHQFSPLFRKYPQFRGVDIKGKTLPAIRMQPTWFYGAGRKEAIKIIADFVKKHKPYAIKIDHEVNPYTHTDVSPAAMTAFAKYARLSTVPDKKDISGKYKEQWADFACWTWGKIAEVFKEGVKTGNSATLFSIYSSYQSPALMRAYSCNWKYFRKSIDIASMGYGRQTEKIRSDTLNALDKVPAYFGASFWSQSPPGYGKLLKNVFIRRVVDSGAGVMEYNWARLEGISKTKIAEACNILSKYEPFFTINKQERNFSTGGDFSNHDIVILKNKGQKLIIAFNPGGSNRKGSIKLGNKTIRMEVKPYDVNAILIK